MSQPPLSLFSSMMMSGLRCQSAGIALMQEIMSVPYRVSSDIAAYALDMSLIGPGRHRDVIGVSRLDYDRIALEIAEGEGMHLAKEALFETLADDIAAYEADCNVDAVPIVVDHAPEIQKAWAYTRPPAEEQDLLIERRMHSSKRFAYTPQGQAPDTPSAKRVIERYRALRQVL